MANRNHIRCPKYINCPKCQKRIKVHPGGWELQIGSASLLFVVGFLILVNDKSIIFAVMSLVLGMVLVISGIQKYYNPDISNIPTHICPSCGTRIRIQLEGNRELTDNSKWVVLAERQD
jgi:hypothetical protein